tara:strand:+ start:2782 stop:3111 length:330 start_codon:yes stop_codon:yes gene_type:complete
MEEYTGRASEISPTPHLSAADFDGEMALTMKFVSNAVKVGSGEDADFKHVLYFEELERGLVLNTTNRVTIAGMYGQKVVDWKGKKVTIYPTTTSIGGRHDVPCLRIRRN